MGAAVMAMFATSCQNEVVVDDVQSTGKGEFFTLEVGKGFESRTVLSGNATHWCEDDAIFVSGADGKVSGVLTFESYVGDNKSQAKFGGWISGGQPSELEHIVFPVPQGGKIDMAKRDPNKLDAPMIGTIGNGAVQTLKNVGGLVAFQTDGGNYDVEAISGENNMGGGSYTFDPVNGTLTYKPGNGLAPAYNNNGKAYVPVATTTDPTNGTSVTTLEDVKLNLLVDKQVVASANVNVTSGEIFGDEDGENTGALDVKVVKDATELVDAIKVGGYVKLSGDITIDEELVIEELTTLDFSGGTLTAKFANPQTDDSSMANILTGGGSLLAPYAIIVKSGELTLKDDGLVNTKSIVTNSNGIITTENAKLNVDGTEVNAYYNAIVSMGSDVTIYGARCVAEKSSAVYCDGPEYSIGKNVSAWKLLIKNGYFESKAFCAVSLQNNLKGDVRGEAELLAGTYIGSESHGHDVYVYGAFVHMEKSCSLKNKKLNIKGAEDRPCVVNNEEYKSDTVVEWK